MSETLWAVFAPDGGMRTTPQRSEKDAWSSQTLLASHESGHAEAVDTWKSAGYTVRPVVVVEDRESALIDNPYNSTPHTEERIKLAKAWESGWMARHHDELRRRAAREAEEGAE